MGVFDIVLPVTAATLLTAAKLVLGFVAALFAGALLLPGLERDGYPQLDGTTKTYKLTGMTLFFTTHVVVAALVFGFGVSLTVLVTHFWSLFVVANVLAFVVTAALYAWGRRQGPTLRSSAFDQIRMPRLVRNLWFGNEL